MRGRVDGGSGASRPSPAGRGATRRRGLARAAILRSLELLRAEGATSAYLGVDTDNHNRASALYKSCGFRKVSGSAAYRKPFNRQESAP